jgi:DNA-binding transcriptional LysR family regulator
MHASAIDSLTRAGTIMLEWDDFRVFLAIARHGSLTAAARALRVTQPTMGRRLEMLEERLGTRLFERTPTGPVLTDLGAAILNNAEQMEQAVLAAERRIAGHDNGLLGAVRLTSVEWFGSHVLASIIASFSTRYPQIAVELLTDVRSYNLAKREADIAIRFARFEQNEVVQRKIGDFAYGLYASTDYLDQYGLPNFDGKGADHAVVTMHEAANHMPEARWLLEELAPKARIALRSSSRDVQARAAESGAGLVVLPRGMGDRMLSLHHLETPSPVPSREVWLGYHQDMRQTPRIRVLVDFLADELRNRMPQLHPRAA